MRVARPSFPRRPPRSQALAGLTAPSRAWLCTPGVAMRCSSSGAQLMEVQIFQPGIVGEHGCLSVLHPGQMQWMDNLPDHVQRVYAEASVVKERCIRLSALAGGQLHTVSTVWPWVKL